MAARTNGKATAAPNTKTTPKPASKSTRKPSKSSKKTGATHGATTGKVARKPATKPARKAPAKAKPAVSPVPRGYRTVTPSLNLADAKATIAFCRKAFGAKIRGKMPGPKGKLMHAEIEIGNSIVMLSDAIMEPARVASLFLYVDNVDKTIAKAVKAGAKVVMPANDMFWGDRYAKVVDPQGNVWGIGARVEKVSPAELKKRTKVAAKEMAAAMAAAS